MTEKEIRALRDKIGTDPILTDEEIEYIWMAMDKQISMKTRFYKVCGNCKDALEGGSYCPGCGQKIDWED